MISTQEIRKLPRPLRMVVRKPWARWRRLRLTPKQRRRLRRWLDTQGHITPNFTWAEARSKPNPREPRGRDIPSHLRGEAIHHAWRLEQVRHQAGDAPVGILSWYRSLTHNGFVGGASQSRHMMADATDFTPAYIARVGRTKLMGILNRIFRKGGVGDYPSGAVHADSRGHRARWSSF